MASSTNQQFDSDCIFCRVLRGDLTPGVIAYRDDATAVFPSLRQRPQNRGHMLVVPVSHVSNIYELDRELGSALIQTVAAVARALKLAFSAQGIAIKQHNEKHGGQDIFHVHFHVIPCYANDGFFRGDERFPRGMREVPIENRRDQARLVGATILDDKAFTRQP